MVAEPSGRERAESLEAAGVLKDARIAELVHEIDGLHTAMEHRADIEQAKGINMNVMGCGPEAAFAVLVFQSQHQNRKVRDIAAEIVGAQDRDLESN
jgi:AmiR/NasT family two-component response regulator